MPTPLASPSRRLAAVTAGLALLAPALITAAAGPASAGPDVRRLSGADRFATAVAVAKASHPTGAPVVVLTTGATFPDALAGGPAAAALGGPVLLVARDAIPAPVADELRRLQPRRVLVLGGVGAVAEAPVQQLRSQGYDVQRVFGASRYDTAAAVSTAVFPTGPAVAYVATGQDYPDALAGAAAASAAKAPVLLTARDALPPATATELQRLRPQRIVVLGGAGAVSARVEQQLAAYAPAISRIAGADRYATAAAIARAAPGRPGAIYLATGQGFADALAGGPAAGRVGAPVLLTPPSCIPGPVHIEMERHGYPPVTLLGGPAALTARVAELRPCFRAGDGELAPGVRLTTLDDPRGPWHGKLVEVAPSAVWRLDTVLGQDALPGLETTSSIARRTGAVVAVNGDFALSGGRPVHAFARDGRLLQTPQLLGRNVAVESGSGTPRLGFPTVDVAFHSPGSRVPVTRVNAGPSDGDSLALRTPQGGSLAPVPGGSCAVRLQTRGAPELVSGRAVQGYEIVQTGCGSAPMTGAGDVVTAPADGRYAPLLQTLTPGQVVSVSWSLGWRDVLDAIGGNPTLLEGGQIIAGNVDGTDAFSRRNPRTAVGYRADGTVLLVTVDGRGGDGSVGMSLRELADLFARLGASDALNLDGGGSTAMVIGGELQNVPSDGTERPVSSALIVRPGSRPLTSSLRTGPDDEPAAAPVPLPAEEQQAAEAQIAADPGSTGGWLRAGGGR